MYSTLVLYTFAATQYIISMTSTKAQSVPDWKRSLGVQKYFMMVEKVSRRWMQKENMRIGEKNKRTRKRRKRERESNEVGKEVGGCGRAWERWEKVGEERISRQVRTSVGRTKDGGLHGRCGNACWCSAGGSGG